MCEHMDVCVHVRVYACLFTSERVWLCLCMFEYASVCARAFARSQLLVFAADTRERADACACTPALGGMAVDLIKANNSALLAQHWPSRMPHSCDHHWELKSKINQAKRSPW